MCLVKTAIPMSSVVQRHGHEGIPPPRLGMAIKGLDQPLGQPHLLIILVAILEADDRLADLSLSAITGPGPFEMPVALPTIVTNKRGVMRNPRIGKAALLAEGTLDRHRLRLLKLGQGEGEIQGALGPVPDVGSG